MISSAFVAVALALVAGPASGSAPEFGTKANEIVLTEATAMDCGPGIGNIASVVAAGTIVMLGEVHGSVEMPKFAGDLACQPAMAGHTVVLGVEIPRSEQPAIDRYLLGKQPADDRTALLRSDHWHRLNQDGRSSQAMADLLERVRLLRNRGLMIDVLAFDTSHHDNWSARDLAMATSILDKATATPSAFVVTLSGNLHNRTVARLKWDPTFVPMGVHVKGGHARVVSLNGLYDGGSVWMCEKMGGCGIKSLPTEPSTFEVPTIEMGYTDEVGWDGRYFVGRLSASLPAVSLSAPKGPAARATIYRHSD